MSAYALSMSAVVFFYLIYHLCQRGIPTDVNPAASLVVTYLVSLALSCLLFLAFPAPEGAGKALREVNWVSYALAIGVVGLEAGFLLSYRSGWKIGLAAIYSNVAVTLLLLPIGMVFFRERLSWTQALGMVLAVFGLVLMNLESKPV